MKKIYYLLIAFMLVGVLIGCSNSETNKDNNNDNSAVSINKTGFPIVDEEITIEMVGQKNPIQAEWKDMSILQEYEDMTNIHIEWETPSGDAYEEKFNLLRGREHYQEPFFGAELVQADKRKIGDENRLMRWENWMMVF